MLAWVLRTDDLAGTLARAEEAGFDPGRATAFRRNALRWQFSLRDDGAIGLGGAAPLIIEWQTDGAHPAAGMADVGLRLERLEVQTPEPENLMRLLDAIGLKDRPSVIMAPTVALCATLRLADGQKVVLQ